jgi:hypothetical protein
MRSFPTFFLGLATAVPFFTPAGAGRTLAGPLEDRPWARVIEDDGAIRVETDTLEAVIPKKDPKDLPGVEAAATLLPDRTRGAASWAGNPPLRYRQAEGATAL